jgi:hypothetical protein
MQLLTNALRSFTAYNRVTHRLFSCICQHIKSSNVAIVLVTRGQASAMVWALGRGAPPQHFDTKIEASV